MIRGYTFVDNFTKVLPILLLFIHNFTYSLIIVEVEEEVPGAPVRDPRGSWSREVALRVEKHILEQIEGLEDKVASASMQIPVSEDVKIIQTCQDDFFCFNFFFVF